MLEKIKETAKFLNEKVGYSPDVAIILGTGLGELANNIKEDISFDYSDIPNFPVSTVEGHKGKLIFGELGGKKVVALQGRFHYYEGYNMQEVTFPVRVFKLIGVEKLIVSNASGGLNPDYKLGELVILKDHINFFPEHPLRGKNIDELGPRFPDMSEPYKIDFIKKAKKIALENNIDVKVGIYAGVSGPTFETPAEYLYFRHTGADCVGMSTVPEVIVARHMNMEVFGMSVITDSGVPGEIVEVSHEEVQLVAQKVAPYMTTLVTKFIETI